MKYIGILLFCLISFNNTTCYAYEYDGSTRAAVVLSGGIIKAQHTENTKKYKRKDCPVCKGKGWYMSGDDITKVPCGYCEPESNSSIIISSTNNKPVCTGPECKKQPFVTRK